jgi:DNA-directed RNA polymerase specialized sigma24 family protein
MSRDAPDSVTRWLTRLKTGDDEAAQPLWERYFEKLVRLAERKLRMSPRPRTVEDEEDVALSAFHSFCMAAQRGRFPRLDDRDDLWRLLICMTARKAIDQMDRRSAQKRGAHNVVLEADLGVAREENGDWDLDEVVGTEPTPIFAAQVAEDLEVRIEGLRDPILERIALMKLAGHANEEIAAELGCALRSVTLRLQLIRMRWSNEAPP